MRASLQSHHSAQPPARSPMDVGGSLSSACGSTPPGNVCNGSNADIWWRTIHLTALGRGNHLGLQPDARLDGL